MEEATATAAVLRARRHVGKVCVSGAPPTRAVAPGFPRYLLRMEAQEHRVEAAGRVRGAQEAARRNGTQVSQSAQKWAGQRSRGRSRHEAGRSRAVRQFKGATFRQMLVSHERTARMQRDARAEQTNATALAATGGGSMRQQDARRARSAMGWHGAHTCRNRSLEAGS